jgi:2-dehydro-3-deoxy-D-arabinonate dehydratase
MAGKMPPRETVGIHMVIRRGKGVVFEGRTRLTQMARTFGELVGWLGRDNSFPHGVFLLTGTGIVPDNTFSLQAGDTVGISIDGIGTLVNSIVKD